MKAHWDLITVFLAAIIPGIVYDGPEGAGLTLLGVGLGAAVVFRNMRKRR